MISSSRLAARVLLVALLSIAAASCGSDSTGPASDTPETPVATSIAVDPATTSLTAVGATVQLSATVRDQSGGVMSGASVSWTSGNPAVATVSAGGLVTAVSAGTATISAASGSATQGASLTVTQVVSSVAVTPSDATVGQGESTSFQATALDANANPIAGASLSWSSGDSNIATVSAAGLVRGMSAGTTTITASAGSVQGSGVVTVLPPPVTSVTLVGLGRVKVGDAYDYSLTARLADGTVVNRPVTWGVLDASRGAIDQSGRLVPLRSGTVTILATIDGVVWSVDVTAYDWQVLSGSTTSFLVLDADVEITNQYGSSEYPELVLSCNTSTQNFFAWVSTEGFVTESGRVAYGFDEGSIVTQTWIEFDNFSALGHPGPTNLQTKSFATAMAGARTFAFGFTEFRGSAKVTLFRVTGLSSLLPSLMSLCPSNAVVAGAPAIDQARIVSEWRELRGPEGETSELRTARENRRNVEAALTDGVSAEAFPALAVQGPVREEIPATRRRD
ncbi:Ig-like domain-containing protein [Gemmatimonadota bacterium Y43]|uniref:Ig-like domain-containing protein n=1 Tax=Gaopeijia maritima TaxID=3119007 RepID=UPI00328D489F